VNYEADSAVSYTCYDESGKVQTKDCYYEKEAEFNGVGQNWNKWLLHKMLTAKMPEAYYQGRLTGTVYVQFVIDTSGNVTDVKVPKPLNPELDKIAINIILQSPRWQPAVQYNRKVKAYRRQPMTFLSGESQ
jgi:protein TonB